MTFVQTGEITPELDDSRYHLFTIKRDGNEYRVIGRLVRIGDTVVMTPHAVRYDAHYLIAFATEVMALDGWQLVGFSMTPMGADVLNGPTLVFRKEE